MVMLYFVSVWLHILAATIWVGGMGFLVLVVVPWLRRCGGDQAGIFLRETGERFRTVAWACFAIAVTTGGYNLWVRGVRLESLLDPEWRGSRFGQTVIAKLGVFVVVLAVSAFHDFLLGPRASKAIQENSQSPEAQRLRRRASLLGRFNALLALVLVGLAVMLVRGLPW